MCLVCWHSAPWLSGPPTACGPWTNCCAAHRSEVKSGAWNCIFKWAWPRVCGTWQRGVDLPGDSATMALLMKTAPHTLEDWLAHCEHLHPTTVDLGLERVRTVAQRMGIRFNCPVIMVA